MRVRAARARRSAGGGHPDAPVLVHVQARQTGKRQTARCRMQDKQARKVSCLRRSEALLWMKFTDCMQIKTRGPTGQKEARRLPGIFVRGHFEAPKSCMQFDNLIHVWAKSPRMPTEARRPGANGACPAATPVLQPAAPAARRPRSPRAPTM